jgi:hypothetical protein
MTLTDGAGLALTMTAAISYLHTRLVANPPLARVFALVALAQDSSPVPNRHLINKATMAAK